MKLRIRDDSVRLRLKRSEVEGLAAGGSIVATTHFPDSQFSYRLDAVDRSDIAADFANGTLAIGLPADVVAGWANGDDVSIHAELPLADGSLSILVEKDFACLAPGDHREHEDDADTFPHPAAESGGGC
jgi:hypothetical protein